MAILIDSYSESNVDSGKGLYIGGINTEYASQSFNSGDGGTLDYIVFNLYKVSYLGDLSINMKFFLS